VAAFKDILTLQLQSHLEDGQAVRNSLHFRRNPSAGDVDDAFLTALLADANTTTLINAYLQVLRTVDTLDGVLARATHDPLFPDDDRPEAYKNVGTGGARTASGTRGPDELGLLLKLSGNLAGRRFRGRSWIPPSGLQGDVNGENVYTPSNYYLKAVLYMAELVKTTYPSGASHYGGGWNDVDMVVFSRKGRLEDETYYSRVSGIQLPLKLHWLRSRNPTQA
jgi:hypothetical protein